MDARTVVLPIGLTALFLAQDAIAHPDAVADSRELDAITVVGSDYEGLTGESDSATEGVARGSQLEIRPVSRPGELLEFVPGLIATQHSGEGKANQFFLRGFNLDHGTDFAISVDGLPVNMRTHAHGQGYADLNFLIPELVESVAYRKGPYYAEIGDFSAAGSADLEYRHRLDATEVELSLGEFDFRRLFGATSVEVGGGDLLLGGAVRGYDGPFRIEQDIEQVNGLIKYTYGDRLDGYGLTLQVYENDWNSPDQIPRRQVDAGEIGRFGFIDPTVGGESHRYSLSADWHRRTGVGQVDLTAYALDYELDLFSNFTYFLDDPVDGDQFEQFDNRRTYGLDAALSTPLDWGADSRLVTGFQLRYDDIQDVGLFRTRDRQRLSTVSNASVEEVSYSLYTEWSNQWSPVFRSVVGLRADHFEFDVDAEFEANSGQADDTILSPKLSLVFGPFETTEWFLNLGKGFHSNDARGTTIAVDPVDGVTPVERVDPLADAYGADLGVRSVLAPGLQLAASIYYLRLDSELVFVGDAGNTEASGASRRYGAEVSLYYRPADWLLVDADYAYANSRFRDAGNEDRIPLAVEGVASLGATIENLGPFSAGLRLRHVGEAPLIEDNSVRSESTTLLNARVDYRLSDVWNLSLAVFNLLDSQDNDITYFYSSRLPGEPAQGVEDLHFHAVEPRNVRLALRASF